MKPITDDVVFSILQGLEKRERRKKPALEKTTTALHEKILKRGGGPRIISLDFARQKARRTVSGMFCYVVRN